MKPSLCFIRWLGNIPLGGECSVCLSKARFYVMPTARPDRADCIAQLERAFDGHLKESHEE
jgi:hypothetical protein